MIKRIKKILNLNLALSPRMSMVQTLNFLIQGIMKFIRWILYPITPYSVILKRIGFKHEKSYNEAFIEHHWSLTKPITRDFLVLNPELYSQFTESIYDENGNTPDIMNIDIYQSISTTLDYDRFYGKIECGNNLLTYGNGELCEMMLFIQLLDKE